MMRQSLQSRICVLFEKALVGGVSFGVGLERCAGAGPGSAGGAETLPGIEKMECIVPASRPNSTRHRRSAVKQDELEQTIACEREKLAVSLTPNRNPTVGSRGYYATGS